MSVIAGITIIAPGSFLEGTFFVSPPWGRRGIEYLRRAMKRSALRSYVVLVSSSVALCACDGGPPATKGGPTQAVSAAPAAAPTRATITLDAAHDVMTAKDAAAYTIPPSAELVIELAGHRFATRDGGAATPDVVHVVHGSTHYHRASFSGPRITLSTGSLDPVKGGAFPGFEAGESYIVAVGTEAPSPDGALRFTPSWTGKVGVAAK